MAEDLVYRLRKRAEIRRQIPSRKSVQEGKADRLADLLEEAADEIERNNRRFGWLERQDLSELSMYLIMDAPGDGNIAVHGDSEYGEGRTLREAIDRAIDPQTGTPKPDNM